MLYQNVLYIRRREKMDELFAQATGPMAARPDDRAGKLYRNTKSARRLVDNSQRGVGRRIYSIDNAYIGFPADEELNHLIVLAIQIPRMRDRSKIQLGQEISGQYSQGGCLRIAHGDARDPIGM